MKREERIAIDNALQEIDQARYSKKSREVKAHYLKNAITYLQEVQKQLEGEV